ncbi:hypothetical protein [Nonomuraea sp. CA-141351]|uniref:hypothetical protein n=1 Tax=Nonomuraea sp. CA-141351 TaxID=3239996 RepID=UPI003D90C890
MTPLGIIDLVAEDVTDITWEELTGQIVNGTSPCGNGCGTTIPVTTPTDQVTQTADTAIMVGAGPCGDFFAKVGKDYNTRLVGPLDLALASGW